MMMNIQSFNKNNNKFLEWFVGFTDAEGCFHIKKKTMSNGNTRYYFEFVIKLHIDNVALLKYIQEFLGIGRIAIRTNSNTCSFEVGSEKDLRILIDIFDNIELMGNKYLDFLSFKKAFFLYFDRSSLVTESLIESIEAIRSNHNIKRTDYTIPVDFKCVITDYKLLGLFEGDGSFVIQKQGLSPKFEIELTKTQRPLLESIQNYLINELKLGDSELLVKQIRIIELPAKGNSKPTVRLTVTGVNLLHNYFNTKLKNLKFFTIKGKDFESFSLICKVLFNKAHLKDENIKNLIIKLINSMNSARLSTYKRETKYLTNEEYYILNNI
uniref:Putative LAGLIDADG endonuclease/maturase n=1 Tax=Ophiostoma novo-ulmi subsp. americana TaxID=170178 RepID=A6XKC9_OPHNO|nr:putative LAGLIDADG endonuclease/maturase [Ophiostoma novo-ulmi subsp. americana]ABI15911.1 putative LAGLIDADG endonuclease/maturase [Ophiostoma novo-ulmi subsp. americana]